MKKLLLLIFALAWQGLASAAAKNVMILVLDGPRYSETWGDKTRQHVPMLSALLAPIGATHASFWNQGPTYTSSGHTAMTTGFYEELENSKGEDLPSHPGIFQLFLKKAGLGKDKAYVVTSKDKLQTLADTKDPRWKGKYRPGTWCGKEGKGPGSGYGDDRDTVAALKGILKDKKPRLTLVNLREPDSGGHSGDWQKYLDGLHASDGYAAEIWAFLQTQPGYKDQTDLFITHDHGRHLDGIETGFKDHGDKCEGCRRIMLWTLGPDFKKGVEVTQPAELIDIPVTIGKILGFEVPDAKGRLLTEIMN